MIVMISLPVYVHRSFSSLLDKLLKVFIFFQGSCGVSNRTFVRTPEAAPMDLSPPVLKALGSACIKMTWEPPKQPNGVIINYFIHR